MPIDYFLKSVNTPEFYTALRWVLAGGAFVLAAIFAFYAIKNRGNE